MTQTKANMVIPPRELFENQLSTLTNKVGENPFHYDLESVEVKSGQGIFLTFKGMKHPIKGWPYPEAIFLCNIVKRQMMMIVQSVSSKGMFLPAVGFLLTPWKYKKNVIEKLIGQFNRNAEYLISTIYVKEDYLGQCPREIKKFIYNFLTKLGMPSDVSECFGKIFATLIEYDDAYRYRIEDLLSESSKEDMMEYPISEVRKLIKIFEKRQLIDKHILIPKFGSFSKIFSAIMYSFKIRNAFIYAIEKSDFKNFQLDEADIYHCLLRTDYNVQGKSVEERLAIYKEIHKDGFPPLIK